MATAAPVPTNPEAATTTTTAAPPAFQVPQIQEITDEIQEDPNSTPLGEGAGGTKVTYATLQGKPVIVKRFTSDRLLAALHEAFMYVMLQTHNGGPVPGLMKFLGKKQQGDNVMLVFEHDGQEYSKNPETWGVNTFTLAQVNEVKPKMKAMLEVVKKMHSLGVVHGDLKPEHVRFSANGNVLIIDLGTALYVPPESDAKQNQEGKKQDATLKKLAMKGIRGSKGYIAPELLLGGQVTSKVDSYSIGILFGMLILGNDFKKEIMVPFEAIAATKVAEEQKKGRRKITVQEIESQFENITRFCEDQDMSGMFKNFGDMRTKWQQKELKKFEWAKYAGQGEQSIQSAIDLIKALIHPDHKKRITVDAALGHPFFAQ